MPIALVTSAVLQHEEGEYSSILKEAGFSLRFSEATGEDLVAMRLVPLLDGVSAVVAGNEPYTAGVLGEATGLRVIARTGVGYDSVDVAAASARRVAVAITPGTNHESVAEQTFALLLGVAKNVAGNHEVVAAGRYDRRITLPLRGRTLGILGLGRAGRAVAERAIAFRMRVIAFDPYSSKLAPPPGVEMVDFERLLARSDYLSLHAPATPDTARILRNDTIAKMKDGAIVVNTARGSLIDEDALAAALRSGKLAGAGLDVQAKEPPIGSPLLAAPNVLFAPHLAGIDSEAIEQMAVMAADTIAELSRGNWPAERIVNAADLAGWSW